MPEKVKCKRCNGKVSQITGENDRNIFRTKQEVIDILKTYKNRIIHKLLLFRNIFIEQDRKDRECCIYNVYNRFKHLDKILSDTSRDDDPIHKTCYELWIAIKGFLKESEVENGK